MTTRQERAAARVAEMEWTTFAEAVRGRTRGTGGAASQQALRDYFEPAELEELRGLAEHAAARRAVPKVGNVVFLHGIMGATLATVAGGDEDVVWINLFRLARGHAARLRLTPDGAHNAGGFTVRTAGLDKRTYAKAVLWLQARWNVEPFAYDWRLDIDQASHALAACITERFGDEPVHLVAHSMGGLVCRNFIRLHPQLWQSMRDPAGKRGGRLIMLGTPNYGSYAIPQALTGEEKLVRWLAAADLSHNLGELLEILNSFVGSYEMLPAPSKLPAAAQAIYRAETWQGHPVSATHLARAMQFHADLEKGATVDPARMVYVAGSGRETLSGMAFLGGGEFAYSTTPFGDGRVTHALGRLDGVPTYFVDEVHGDLPRNQRVLAAVDELLEAGSTASLPTQAPPVRSARREGARALRPAGDSARLRELKRVAERAERDVASSAEVRWAEDALSRALTGRPERGFDTPGEEAAAAAAPREPDVTLTVELVQRDIAAVHAPVLVVGHYKGVAPTNAVGALNAKLDGWIGDIQRRGILSADLGEVFFIPVPPRRLAARAIMLAGMGDAGHFTREDLRYLMANVAFAIGKLGISHFATVLVGSGAGNLSRDLALRAFLAGVADGMRRLPRGALRRLTLIELYERPCTQLRDMLDAYGSAPAGTSPTAAPDAGAQAWSIPGLRLRTRLPRTIKADPRTPAARRLTTPHAPPASGGKRITVERAGERFRFSALTDTAVVPVREVSVKPKLARGAADYLIDSSARAEQEKYGRLLATYLMPEEFQGVIEQGPLTLILDRSTAAYPWEMACLRGAGGVRYFGTHLRLTRQFRTMLSRPAGIEPEDKQELCALVIADPAQETDLQLPGARAEGRAVVSVLEAFRRTRPISVVSRIGAAECDPVEILALILSGDFDVIHYAGHGVFDTEHPDKSGWVFARDCILSPADIFQARRVPHLVFANACFSAGILERPAMADDEADRGLAGLAEAFFERGVRNYIGAGWPVDDAVAVAFATTFYEQFLAGTTLSESVATARERAQEQPGSTWGAYQHYGWADERLPAAVQGKGEPGKRKARGTRR